MTEEFFFHFQLITKVSPQKLFSLQAFFEVRAKILEKMLNVDEWKTKLTITNMESPSLAAKLPMFGRSWGGDSGGEEWRAAGRFSLYLRRIRKWPPGAVAIGATLASGDELVATAWASLATRLDGKYFTSGENWWTSGMFNQNLNKHPQKGGEGRKVHFWCPNQASLHAFNISSSVGHLRNNNNKMKSSFQIDATLWGHKTSHRNSYSPKGDEQAQTQRRWCITATEWPIEAWQLLED